MTVFSYFSRAQPFLWHLYIMKKVGHLTMFVIQDVFKLFYCLVIILFITMKLKSN